MLIGQQGLLRKVVVGPFDVADTVESCRGDEELTNPFGLLLLNGGWLGDGEVLIAIEVLEELLMTIGPLNRESCDVCLIAQPEVDPRLWTRHESPRGCEVAGERTFIALEAHGDAGA